MEIKTFNINITEDEMDTLTGGLEMYLEDSMKGYKDYKTLDLLEEENLRLLQDFINIGGNVSIVKEQKVGKFSFESKRYTDAWEWAKVRFKQIKNAS